jgi:formiminotetrahydrofolate cyclodeaminase
LEVPRTIALEAVKLYDAIETASQIGNPSALSDAGVASLLLDTAVKGAVYNVKINLPMVKDETLKKTLFEEAEKLTAMSIERSGGIFRHVTDTLNRQI